MVWVLGVTAPVVVLPVVQVFKAGIIYVVEWGPPHVNGTKPHATCCTLPGSTLLGLLLCTAWLPSLWRICLLMCVALHALCMLRCTVCPKVLFAL